MKRDDFKKGLIQGVEIDPRFYRGPVEVDRCYIPALDTNGARYDSRDGVTVDGPVRGDLVDYYGDRDSGDLALITLNDGRAYWFRWHAGRIRKVGG